MRYTKEDWVVGSKVVVRANKLGYGYVARVGTKYVVLRSGFKVFVTTGQSHGLHFYRVWPTLEAYRTEVRRAKLLDELRVYFNSHQHEPDDPPLELVEELARLLNIVVVVEDPT